MFETVYLLGLLRRVMQMAHMPDIMLAIAIICILLALICWSRSHKSAGLVLSLWAISLFPASFGLEQNEANVGQVVAVFVMMAIAVFVGYRAVIGQIRISGLAATWIVVFNVAMAMLALTPIMELAWRAELMR